MFIGHGQPRAFSAFSFSSTTLQRSLMTTLSVCQWGACTLTFSTVLDLRNHVKTDHIANGKAIINVNDFEFASRGDGGWYARPKEGVVIAGMCPLPSLQPSRIS
jgi:hypothetical protein